MELDELETRLDAAADRLARAARALPGLDPGSRPFGADGPGRLGELGRAMSTQFTAALDARDRAAGSAGSAVAHLGAGMRHAAAGYRDVDADRGGQSPAGGGA
ncbi:MAG TPA: hypothetical protein VKB59_23220 [Micromonosporaceae bacterium]|nr:hypothetical protein [Micromonosporaceae bacterium]